MGFSPVEQIKGFQATERQSSTDALRRAATQFEAVLLMKLTAALNETNDDDENALFGADGGSGLAKQMFSEQLATTMAESGGVGLSDLILKQIGGVPAKAASQGARNLTGALSAVKSIREQAMPIEGKGFAGNANDAEVISTFEDQIRSEGIDNSLKNLILDGKVVNTTRPRVAPNKDVSDIQTPSVGAVAKTLPAYPPVPVRFQLPVNGRISSVFGNRFHPIDRKVKFHAGLDIAVPIGTPVDAAAGGVVEFAGKDGSYGNLVVIRHADGRESRYGHLSKLLVADGDAIVAGQTVALSGSTGKTTGPHVHFEIRENGQAVNPLNVLSNVLPKIAER